MFAFIRSLGFLDIITAVLDIAIVSYVFYRLFLLIRGTRAVPLLRGLVILLAATSASSFLHLYTVHWVLTQVQVPLLVALPIVFYPEVRRALEQLGRGRFFAAPAFAALRQEDLDKLFDELGRAIDVLSRNKIGGLIVLERDTGLNDIVETGTRIDGLVTSQLLINIFIPNTPLHDGAVIIRGNRVLAAGTFLPLTENTDIDRELGTRHRAAIGVSEHSDALALVVSEETGIVSLANAGKLVRNLDPRTLKEVLAAVYQPKAAPHFHFPIGGRGNG
ncbi:MAG: diadenylate cyclase CdaA [Chloroflexota bacterium]